MLALGVTSEGDVFSPTLPWENCRCLPTEADARLDAHCRTRAAKHAGPAVRAELIESSAPEQVFRLHTFHNELISK
jgi:hypothetical protein